MVGETVARALNHLLSLMSEVDAEYVGSRMDREQVHFEVVVRKKAGSSWTLELATESRTRALEEAEDALATKRVVSVRVTKETLDPDTREFKTITILAKGEPDKVKQHKVQEEFEPLCVSPQDLYTGHARDRIGRLLESWLTRHKVTPFELLHRPDLIEKLEAAGMDLQHAIQKIAIPEAQSRGTSVHEIIRAFQRLVQASIERVLKDARRGAFPDVTPQTFAAAAEKAVTEVESQYILGVGVARAIAGGASWSQKVDLLLDLADAAPRSTPARGLALQVIELPLAEVLCVPSGMGELLGPDLDLGGSLAAMTRLAAAETAEALAGIEPAVAKVMPPLHNAAARLANWLDGPHFEHARTAIARRVLKELTGPRRLRPTDAAGEIAVLRALAMVLTASAGRLMSLEEVQEVFITRSAMLVRSDFVESYLDKSASPLVEVEQLLWLSENITGAANKRHAGRWIAATVGSLRFETSMRESPEAAGSKLATLANLQRSVRRVGFVPEDVDPIVAKLGDIGGLVEADARLTATLSRSNVAAFQKLSALLRLANGEAAPIGPAADRAKAEAMKLLRVPETRAELAKTPEAVDHVRAILQTLGMAA